MHNGTTILDEYGHNLDRLKVSLFFTLCLQPSAFFIRRNCLICSPQAGDTVGVVRKEDGSLHFFVNGVAQGPAAWNVPPSVYAVVDLYGQAAQATIMDDMGERRRTVGAQICGRTFRSNSFVSPSQLTFPLSQRTAQRAPQPCLLGAPARSSGQPQPATCVSTSCTAPTPSSPTGGAPPCARTAAASSTTPSSCPTGEETKRRNTTCCSFSFKGAVCKIWSAAI